MNSSSPATRRLFIALFPEQPVCSRLHDLARSVIRNPGARLVPPANLHLTLRFLGQLDAAAEACLQRTLEQVAVQGFRIRFVQIEFRQRQQMLWAPVESVPDALSELATAIDRAADDCGMDKRDHVFRPHVTLARKVRTATHQQTMEEGLETTIKEFCLVRSDIQKAGSRYTRLQCWRLGDANIVSSK